MSVKLRCILFMHVYMHKSIYIYIHVCVCVRERERERETGGKNFFFARQNWHLQISCFLFYRNTTILVYCQVRSEHLKSSIADGMWQLLSVGSVNGLAHRHICVQIIFTHLWSWLLQPLATSVVTSRRFWQSGGKRWCPEKIRGAVRLVKWGNQVFRTACANPFLRKVCI